MALARQGLKNLRRVSPFSLSPHIGQRGVAVASQSLDSQAKGWFSTAASEQVSNEKSESREVAVSEEGSKKSKQFPSKKRRRGLWWNNRHDFVPSELSEFFPSGLGNALLQASENMNRLFENLAPYGLIRQMKEEDECYKLQYEVRGLAKEDMKITIEDGLLRIKGEHKEEGGEDSDDERWSSSSYGYYHTTLLLPEDAKVEEIKAEMKDGVLTIIIPRTERQGRDVKEVLIQ